MYNKSKTYLLPLLAEFISLDISFMKYLKNTYMFYEDENEFYLCLLYNFNFKDPNFTKHENQLINNELFYKLIDVDNQVLYIFKFPEKYKQDFRYFKDSKYSKLSEDSKKLILKFWNKVYSGNSAVVPFLIKVKQILYRDERLKLKIEKDLNIKLSENQELGDFIDIKKETFNMYEYKNQEITP